MDDSTRIEVEAATFRRFLAHLNSHKEVQNIELMLLADFCRNCLAKWYSSEAKERQVEMDYDQAREIVYGMPYAQWKEHHQVAATPEQMTAFQAKKSNQG